MKKGLTELVFILDRSGSMFDLASDTIGGFNSMLYKQKKSEHDVLVSTVLFNHEVKVIHDRVKLQYIPKMTSKDYEPEGCTALLDTIGGSIKHIRNVHRYIREEDVPEHTLFVIITDGLENASHKYDSSTVKKMVKEQQDKGWEFLFLGANIDAVETARGFGIDGSRAVNFHNDSKGIYENFRAMSAVCAMFSHDGKINDNWKSEIEKDFISRERN